MPPESHPAETAVSVLVRTCNRPMLLARALGSLAAQSRPPTQVVVINDGGAGADVEACLKSALGASTIATAVLHNPVPTGRAAALNQGLAAANGAWIAVLDDDDTWHPRFLERVLGLPELTAGRVHGVVTLTTEVMEEERVGRLVERRRRPLPGQRLRAVQVGELAAGNLFTINAFVFSREKALGLGGYRHDLPVLEDWDFNLRYVAANPVGFLPEYLAYYHKRPAAKGASANTDLDLHQTVKARLQDEWLRADLASGRFGLGMLSLQADLHRELEFLFRLRRGLLRVARVFGWRS